MLTDLTDAGVELLRAALGEFTKTQQVQRELAELQIAELKRQQPEQLQTAEKLCKRRILKAFADYDNIDEYRFDDMKGDILAAVDAHAEAPCDHSEAVKRLRFRVDHAFDQWRVKPGYDNVNAQAAISNAIDEFARALQ